MQILGIDIGGSGIKGALVDSETGELSSDRIRIATPQPALPEAVADVIKEIVSHFKWKGPVGCGFPTPFHKSACLTGGNLHPSWKGVFVAELFHNTTGNAYTVVNDADAAGIAEIAFGKGKGVKGTVVMITLGTGIGSAVFLNGKLLPNTEFGHVLYKNGEIFEKYAADSVRKKENLNSKQWGKRLHKYFKHIELILSPDLFIVGGGISRKLDKYTQYISVATPIVAAESKNEAGIIGAALAAIR